MEYSSNLTLEELFDGYDMSAINDFEKKMSEINKLTEQFREEFDDVFKEIDKCTEAMAEFTNPDTFDPEIFESVFLAVIAAISVAWDLLIDKIRFSQGISFDVNMDTSEIEKAVQDIQIIVNQITLSNVINETDKAEDKLDSFGDNLQEIIDTLANIATISEWIFGDLLSDIVTGGISKLGESILGDIFKSDMLPDGWTPEDESVVDKTKEDLAEILLSIDETCSAIADKFTELQETLSGIIDAMKVSTTEESDSVFDHMSGKMNAFLEFCEGVFDLLVGVLFIDLESLKEGFGEIIDAISESFRLFTEGLESLFSDAWKFIQDVFAPAAEFFTGIWDTVTSILDEIWKTISESVSGAFKGAINGVLSYAEEKINKFIRAINSVVSIINKIPGVNIGRISEVRIPRLALGGMVMPGQLFIAREAGPELVGSFGSRSAVMNNNQIVESVSRGVAMANMGEMALLREQNDLLRALLNKKGSIAIGEREFGEVVVNALNRRTYELGDSGLRF